MTLILLLDLDDTLLSNRMQSFQPAYLKALGKHLSRYFSPEKMKSELLAATQKMLTNNRPDRTLEEVFDSSFYPALGVVKNDLKLDIDCFYSDIFPSLRSLTAPRPDAKKLIDIALRKGWRLVVATNPLFPKTAILQRLDWAGLSAGDIPFELIPSYSTFHFAKPNPAFFTELLAQLGSPTDPAIMIGNDYEMDIFPAIKSGLAAFWLTSEHERINPSSLQPTGLGNFLDLIQWLENTNPADIKLYSRQPNALIATLKSTPAALSTGLKSLPQDQWNIRSIPNEWSLTEIICHLRDVDQEVNFPRLKKLASEENPFLPGVDSDPWAEEREYRLQDGEQALIQFINTRMEMIAMLENLKPADWNRISRHAIFGPTRLSELVEFTVSHDRNHLSQWRKVYDARQYSPIS
jgi:FMN phosphatase YigB (HAD superfamily)